MNSSVDRPKTEPAMVAPLKVCVLNHSFFGFIPPAVKLTYCNLLSGLLHTLITTYFWHHGWRSLIIWNFEKMEQQKSTLYFKSNMVPPSQGQKSVHKHFLSGSEFPREKTFNANSRLHFISESCGLVPHSSETRCISPVTLVLSPTQAARSIFCEVLSSTVCLCFPSLSPSGAIDSV